MSGLHDPLEQFKIKTLFQFNVGGVDIVFTNSALFLAITLMILLALYILGQSSAKRKIKLIDSDRESVLKLLPNRILAGLEFLYESVINMAESISGPKASKYVPFIFTLYIFLLICNLLGMIPGAFAVTSHIAITFSMALFVFLAITLIGFIKHGLHYFALFLPKGTPVFMAPLMFFIEMFAYLVRPVSLSLRLATNMTAGHIMLKVIASFVIMSGVLSSILGVFPFALLVILTGFEIFIAILQAYIFTILSCVYLSDALNLH